jgi:hypothetical protein
MVKRRRDSEQSEEGNWNLPQTREQGGSVLIGADRVLSGLRM